MYKVICLLAAFCCLITLSACAKKQQTVIEQTAEYMRAGLENQQTGTVQSAVSQDASAEIPCSSPHTAGWTFRKCRFPALYP